VVITNSTAGKTFRGGTEVVSKSDDFSVWWWERTALFNVGKRKKIFKKRKRKVIVFNMTEQIHSA